MNKIYKLIHNGVVVYVGKTKQTLKRRKAGEYRGNASVQEIYKECDMVLIEETNDVSRERYWIDYYRDTLLNIEKGDTGLSRNEYVKEYGKEWYQSNKEHHKEYNKKWYEANKEKINQYRRECYQKKKLKHGETTDI
jgi:hypothetical protein